MKTMINVDDLSDRQWITTIATELHVENRAVNMPKLKFSAEKILAGRYFNTYLTTPLSVQLKFVNLKRDHLNSG